MGEVEIDRRGADQPTVCSQGGRECQDHSSEPALSEANTPRDSTRYGSGGHGALRSRASHGVLPCASPPPLSIRSDRSTNDRQRGEEPTEHFDSEVNPQELIADECREFENGKVAEEVGNVRRGARVRKPPSVLRVKMSGQYHDEE